MTTQELKQYIDKVLGNNIRCLLPSYWWKRLFSLTLEKVDEKLDATNIKTINGESIVGDGNLKVGVTTVGSIDELNALEAEVGDIATATREAEKFVGVGTLLQYEDGVDYNSLFKVKKVSISVPKTSIGELSLVHLSTREGNITLTIVCSADGKDGYIQAWYEDGRKVDLMREQTLVQSNIDDLNSYLSKNVVRYISAGASSGSHFEFIDTWFKVATPYTVADAYIKGDSWEMLTKENVVNSEDELDRLIVPYGSIAKVNSKKYGKINPFNCYRIIPTSQPSSDAVKRNWDKLKRITQIDVTNPDTEPSSMPSMYLHGYANFSGDMIQISYYNGYKIATSNGSTTTIVSFDDLNSLLKNSDYRLLAISDTDEHREFFDKYVSLYSPDFIVPNAYIKGDSWERLAKEGENGGGSVIFSIPLSGDITDITENQRNRNIESYQKVIKAFEDNIVLDIKINQLFISNVSLYVIDVNKNIVAMVFNRDNSVYTYRFSSDGNFTREIEEGSSSGAEIREFYIGDSLTDEQKAWNLETLELAKQGKAIVRTTLHGNTFILELFNEDNDYQFGYTQFSPSGGVAISVGVTEDGLSGIKIEESHFDSELSTTSINAVQNKVITSALNNKVDKVNGKQLSTEDFTSALRTKLEGLRNYDDTSIQNAVNSLTTQINTLVSSDASVAIESFNEIIAFLNGVEDSESLDSIIAAIEQQIAAKQDKISDLETIRSGAALGATALQEHQDISHLATKEELTSLTNEIIANEEVSAAAFNEINDRINAISENVSGTTVTKEEFESTVETINQTISDNKSATDTAIEGLETSIGNVDAKFANYATTESLNGAVETINNTIVENEEITAAAINDFNTRLAALEAVIANL